MDSSFLHIENDTTPMHIGGVSIFAGPPPPFDQLRAMVAGKLALVPRYRQKVRSVPLAAGPPVWIEDPHFSIDYHLRRTAIPAPGEDSQLRQMAARVFSQALDRNKPLWELWMVEGMTGGRWALLSKVHHCMVDGVAATDLMSVMFSDETTPSQSPSDSLAGRHSAPPEPSSADVLARTLLRRVSPAGQLETLERALRAPRETLRTLAEVARGALAASSSLRPVGASSLNGPIGPHRRWSWATVSLPDVKAVRAELGGTVNDVVLTVITNGFRELLQSRGEPVPEDRVVRTMVPVSVRARGEQGVYNNRVSAVFAGLPVGVQEPVERLQRIRKEMDGVKQSKQAVAGDVLSSLSGFAPPLLLALGSRLVTLSPRLNMHTATTNVPAPSSRSRRSGDGCSSPTRSCQLSARSASSWRSSPTTAGCTSGSQATTTGRLTSRCSRRGSKAAWPTCWRWSIAPSPAAPARRATATSGQASSRSRRLDGRAPTEVGTQTVAMACAAATLGATSAAAAISGSTHAALQAPTPHAPTATRSARSINANFRRSRSRRRRDAGPWWGLAHHPACALHTARRARGRGWRRRDRRRAAADDQPRSGNRCRRGGSRA
ncbi:MAG TPA: wax ester/triacylglycerol synthase family O-acyltransferase [Solirubrobacteraceae bacterium]